MSAGANRRSAWKDVVCFLVLAVSASYCSLPLLLKGSLPFIDDMAFHVFHADQFSKAVFEGSYYPRWVADANNGYGSPTFVFYSPLSYYCVTIVSLAFPSVVPSMIMVIWLGFFLSGVTMMIAVRKIWESGYVGPLFSALAYQLLPVHLRDLYVRGSLSGVLAWVWFPLLIMFLFRLLETGKKSSFLGLSLCYAGLILTHIVSGFIFTLLAVVYLVYRVFSGDRKGGVLVSLALVCGLGIAGFYLIPAVVERGSVHIDYIVTSVVGDFRRNFLFTSDKFQDPFRGFYLPLHAAVIFEIAVFFLIASTLRRLGRISPSPRLSFFVFAFFLSFFLATPLSRPLWELTPGLPQLQFPWRWLVIGEVSIAFLMGALFSEAGFPRERGRIRRLNALLMAAVLVMSMKILWGSIELSGQIRDDNDLRGVMDLSKRVSMAREYVPRSVKDMKSVFSEREPQAVSVLSGAADVDLLEWKTQERTLRVRSDGASLLRIRTFFYPGWKAFLDRREVPIETEKQSGAMLVMVPPGVHTLRMTFVNTPTRLWAAIVSMTFFVTVVFAGSCGRRKERQIAL